MEALERYAWPGNVRELENEVQRLVLLCPPGARVAFHLLSPHLRERAVDKEPEFVSAGLAMQDKLLSYERWLLQQALDRNGGNRSLAAKELQLPRQTLSDRMKKVGLV
jgi:transcriptional regulator with PAS, ATPase and Fis domain